jgi:hypothetical protein
MVTQTTMELVMRTKLVIVGGLARNGKSTLCHLLQSHASLDGWHCQRFSFADPLKSIVRMVQSDYVNKNPDSLQATSDYWKLNYGHGCFAKDLIARLNAYQETLPVHFEKSLLLVDDLRYAHEVASCESWAALGRQLYKVRVVRPGFEDFDRDMAHPSETELLDVQYEDYRLEAPDMDQLVIDSAELWTLIKS